jgi:hypothetical protein
LFSTNETVVRDTPARRATSLLVGGFLATWGMGRVRGATKVQARR